MKFLLIFFLLNIFHSFSQDSLNQVPFTWEKIIEGFHFAEIDAPYKSIINDSKITLVKINPKHFENQLLIAKELEKKSMTVKEWADTFNLDIVLNAGMYDLANKMQSKGYLQNNAHFNNSALHPNYNSILAFNPTDSSQQKMTVLDLKCQAFSEIKKEYNCFAQGLRMLDCDGVPSAWNKRKQSCSMLVTACDFEGNIYFIFCRSPYSHNEMIAFMQQFNFKLRNAIYMEGGPQTSLYVNIKKEDGTNFKLQKVGSYVSNTYAHDRNDHFWNLPNVIGLKVLL
jgi:hypothetical protein